MIKLKKKRQLKGGDWIYEFHFDSDTSRDIQVETHKWFGTQKEGDIERLKKFVPPRTEWNSEKGKMAMYVGYMIEEGIKALKKKTSK